MQFNMTFKTIFEYILKKLVLCIQIRFVNTEKNTRIASRASCCFKILPNMYIHCGRITIIKLFISGIMR